MEKEKKSSLLKANEDQKITHNYKQNKEEVERLMQKYKKAKIEIQFELVLQCNDKKRSSYKEMSKQYIQYVDKIISLLSHDSKEFFINEYINEQKDIIWWKNIYSRSTFYKVRRKALEEFLLYVR